MTGSSRKRCKEDKAVFGNEELVEGSSKQRELERTTTGDQHLKSG
jgi:hypothetical protein